MTNRVQIRKLMTGIPGLDEVLGGGLPELSFNLVAGAPGAGKTMLAHQFMFHNASAERKAIYFTIFGEPSVKMLRYQQQFEFFDHSKVSAVIRFVHLGEDMIEGGLTRVLERIRKEIQADDARIVIVDSFRSVVRVASAGDGDEMGLERFVQLLALLLTTCEATTFLVGEYLEQETHSNPVFTVADGIVWLYQTVQRNAVVRQLQVSKLRGQAQVPGLHTVKLSSRGMRVFPRMPAVDESAAPPRVKLERGVVECKKTGVRRLDEMLGGGIPVGYSLLVAGPSGSGKTALVTQFVREGAARGEPSVIALFDRRPAEYLKTISRGAELGHLVDEGKIRFVYARPLDLSVDETLDELRAAVTAVGAKRLVIDSLSGFELALAPSFREDFRESLYRMIGDLSTLGVTVMLTAEVTGSSGELLPKGISFLADGILLQKYVEIDGSLRKALTVVKMRGRAHSKDVREYEIDDGGILVADGALKSYRGLMTGAAVSTGGSRGRAPKPSAAVATAKKRRRRTRADR
jgi:circadian clock protein KaiC